MNRRSFFQRTIGAVLAASAAPFLPKRALVFHRDAFVFAMAPLTRLDCLYGFAALRPEVACHIADYPMDLGC